MKVYAEAWGRRSEHSQWMQDMKLWWYQLVYSCNFYIVRFSVRTIFIIIIIIIIIILIDIIIKIILMVQHTRITRESSGGRAKGKVFEDNPIPHNT